MSLICAQELIAGLFLMDREGTKLSKITLDNLVPGYVVT